MRYQSISLFLCIFLLSSSIAMAQPSQADYILSGKVWTGSDDQPWVEAVAVSGNTILAVGDIEELNSYRTSETSVVDLGERMIMPGFIDNHTHFNRAGALLLGVNLLDVSDAEGLTEQVKAAADRLPDGAWITGGDWGAYQQWEKDSSGDKQDAKSQEEFMPHRNMIEEVTTGHPAFAFQVGWFRVFGKCPCP